MTVITTVEPDGNTHGMTANGVASVSLEPPLALVCVGMARNTHALIEATGRFGISVLAANQQPVAEYYMRAPAERTGSVPAELSALEDGWPVVAGALSQMGCRVVSAHMAGDHTVFIARVEAFRTREGEPLVWYRSRFGPLSSP